MYNNIQEASKKILTSFHRPIFWTVLVEMASTFSQNVVKADQADFIFNALIFFVLFSGCAKEQSFCVYARTQTRFNLKLLILKKKEKA